MNDMMMKLIYSKCGTTAKWSDGKSKSSKVTHLHRDEGKSKSLRTLLVPVWRWLTMSETEESVRLGVAETTFARQTDWPGQERW